MLMNDFGVFYYVKKCLRIIGDQISPEINHKSVYSTRFQCCPYTQCAQNRYENDIHFWTSSCSEGSEWQHFPLPITFKTR